MKRICTIDRGRPRVTLSNVTAQEKNKFKALLDELEDSHHHPQVERLVALLQSDFNDRELSPSVIERLSKWCNTGGRCKHAVDPAREVSKFLMGHTLDRLISKDGSRESDYDASVAKIAKRIARSRD